MAVAEKIRGVRYLDDGVTPMFQFFRAGPAGVYNVFVVQSKDKAAMLGQIRTRSPLPKSIDPGAWEVFGDSHHFDSMNAAALELFSKTVPRWKQAESFQRMFAPGAKR